MNFETGYITRNTGTRIHVGRSSSWPKNYFQNERGEKVSFDSKTDHYESIRITDNTPHPFNTTAVL